MTVPTRDPVPFSQAVTIRRARRQDAAALSRIARAAKAHWRYSKALLRLWRSDLTVTPGFVARHPTYCAERRGRLIGFYAIGGRGAVRELAHLWVHPRGIGSGIGRLLLEHLRDRLRALRVTELRIAADPNAVSPFAKPNMSRGPLLFGRIARSG